MEKTCSPSFAKSIPIQKKVEVDLLRSLSVLLPEYKCGDDDPQNDYNHQTTEKFQPLSHGSRILLNATSDGWRKIAMSGTQRYVGNLFS
jgi:hypothetical protein